MPLAQKRVNLLRVIFVECAYWYFYRAAKEVDRKHKDVAEIVAKLADYEVERRAFWGSSRPWTHF